MCWQKIQQKTEQHPHGVHCLVTMSKSSIYLSGSLQQGVKKNIKALLKILLEYYM